MSDTPKSLDGSGQWPDLSAYKQWARIQDGTDDAAATAAIEAVTVAVKARCPSLAIGGEGGPVCPPDVYYAILLWTNRVMARRNSPDGIVGVADLGIANISRFDRDIAQMLSPYLAVVLA